VYRIASQPNQISLNIGINRYDEVTALHIKESFFICYEIASLSGELQYRVWSALESGASYPWESNVIELMGEYGVHHPWWCVLKQWHGHCTPKKKILFLHLKIKPLNSMTLPARVTKKSSIVLVSFPYQNILKPWVDNISQDRRHPERFPKGRNYHWRV